MVQVEPSEFTKNCQSTKETTKQANLIRLRQVIEEITNTGVIPYTELKALSRKRYPVTDEWILWHYERDDCSFLSDYIRKTHTSYVHHLLKEYINEICYNSYHRFSYKSEVGHVRWMITEHSLRAPRCTQRCGLNFGE